jgi:hypothetical protein
VEVAVNVADDDAGTWMMRGRTVADGSVAEKVTDTGEVDGLPTWKATVDPGMAVVAAKCQAGAADVDPSTSEKPEGDPDGHCWNSLLTNAPETTDTTVVASGRLWAKEPTFWSTSCPAFTTMPWKGWGVSRPAGVRKDTSAMAALAVGLKRDSVRLLPPAVDPEGNSHWEDTEEAHGAKLQLPDDHTAWLTATPPPAMA